jgi:hypothetical protein
MKLSAALLALALSGVAVPAWASDQPCGAGCGLQMKACVKTARVGMLSCKMNCRTGSDPNGLGSCIRTCKTTFRSHQGDCRTGVQGCIGSCDPNAPSGSSCVGECGQGLGTCAQGVVSQAKTCLQGCRTASDRLSCLQGCASQAQQGAAGCATGFASCLSSCGVTAIPCLLSGPACGGSCPDGLSCQPPPAGSMSPVACVCRPVSSPSGAFVN